MNEPAELEVQTFSETRVDTVIETVATPKKPLIQQNGLEESKPIVKKRNSILTNAPGIALAVALAIGSIFLAGFQSFLASATIALALGIILGNIGIKAGRIEAGMKFTESKVLETAIVLIAFGLNMKVFTALGLNTWVFVGSSVVMVIGVALIAGRWFGLSLKMGALLGAGSAICGSAAIGAVAPLIHSKEEETGLSIGVINLLSTTGLILLPILSGVLSLSNEDSGLLIGGIIQSMGHVIGAGFSLGEEIGAAATVVKMGRILLIIPLILVFFFISRKDKTSGKKMSFPFFIPWFVLALVLTQMPFFPEGWSKILAKTGDYLLITAMVAIGFKIKLKPLFKLAGPALMVGFIIFAFQIALFLGYLFI